MKLLATALVKAQKEFEPARKDATNPHFRSRYANLSACVDAVKDALNNNGISLIQNTHESDTGVIVETIFLHESGEMLSAGKLHFPASKQDAQGYMSALTYARRGQLLSACGIAPEDDDGNAASRTARNPLDSIPKVPPVPTAMPAKKVDLNSIKEDIPSNGENTTLPTPGSVRLQIPGKVKYMGFLFMLTQHLRNSCAILQLESVLDTWCYLVLRYFTISPCYL